MNIVTGYNDNHIAPATRTVCRFYIRGTCRFGNRCRNIHENFDTMKSPENKGNKKTPEKSKTKSKMSPLSKELESLGAIIFSSSQPCSSSQSQTVHIETTVKSQLVEKFGPSTSSDIEAIALVKQTVSEEKACGICFDIIMQKAARREQMFGILPNCNHCYCFGCIRKWRQTKEFDADVSRACPECRISSEYVYPSRFWLETKEEKDDFITGEKTRMQKIDCRYFKKGNGKCPFGNTCLYLHALPNGKKMDVGPPKPRRRQTSNVDHELVHQILFWLNDDINFDDDDYGSESDFELDLDDPLIAMQYYDHGEIPRYIDMDRWMNGNSDYDSDEFLF